MKNLIAFIICFVLVYSCASGQNTNLENNIISRKYYFVVQIHSLKSDTINYDVIEIYSSTPKFKISNINKENSEIDIVKFSLSSFNKGYVKGLNKKKIGGIIVLYTKDDWIENDNFVKFDIVNQKDKVVLSQMYRLGNRR